MILDRRSMLAAVLATSGAAMARGVAPARRRPLGIQLYMLGPDAVRDLPGTLARVREIGFEEIELPSLLGKNPEVLGRMIRSAGLVCPSMHVPLEGTGLTLAEPDRARDALKAIGANYAIVPAAPFDIRVRQGEPWADAVTRSAAVLKTDDWRRIAAALDAASARLAAADLTVGYHNHDFDMRRLADSRDTPLDILLRETSPDVAFELDVGWAAVAGVDPAALLRRHPRRFHMLHLKDAQPSRSNANANAGAKASTAAPGAGGVDWAAIARIVRRGTIRHLFVEQEPPFAGPRIEAAQAGYAFFAERLR